MRTVGPWVVGFLLALALAVGVLYVAAPANETAEDGLADSILWLRRPVIRALVRAGIVEGPGLFGGHPWLPTVGGLETSKDGPAGEQILTSEMRIEIEPVYRGLLWPVGDRITCRQTLFDDFHETWRSLRLCYAVGAERFVAAETRTPETAGQPAEVSGFIPRSARGYWVERSDETGEMQWMDGWGETDPLPAR